MKAFKRILLVLGILLAVVFVLVGVAFIPGVQKAIVLHFAQEPGSQLQADEIAAGLGGAGLKNVRYTMPGVAVSLDSARVDTSLLGLVFGDTIKVDSVEAKNVVIDLTGPAGPPPPTSTSTEPLAPQGFLAIASLPKALLVGKLALDGKLILSAEGGSRTATFTVASGGIAPGAESVIEAVIKAPAAPGAAGGESRVTIKLHQTPEGKITAAAVTVDVKAQVPEQPPVALTAVAELKADGGKETWSVRITPDQAREPVLAASGTFDPATQAFTGDARIAAAAAIIAPWLPADLPAVAADGTARVAFNLTTLDWEVTASLAGTASGLNKLDERLASLEPVKVQTEIVARSTSGAIQAEKYATTILAAGNQPLLDARLLRPLAIGADGMPERASLEGGPLASVALRDIPLSLARPFLPEGMTLAGGPVNAELNVTAQGDAFLVETTRPLTIPRLEAALPDLPLVAGVDVSARLRARLDLANDRAIGETLELAVTPAAGVTAANPSLQVALAQPVTIDLAAGALVPAGNTNPLARLTVTSLPLALARPYLPDGFVVEGGPLTGTLTISPDGDAFVVATAQPLAIAKLRFAMDGSMLVQDQDLATTLRARLDLASNHLTAEALQLSLAPAGQTAPALRVNLGQPLVIDLDTGEPVFPTNDTSLAQMALAQFPVPDLRAFDPDLVMNPLPRISGALSVKSTADGGWAIATTQPIALTPTSLNYAGEALLASAGVAVQLDAGLAGEVVTVTRGSLELTQNNGRALLAEFSGSTNLETLTAPKFSVKAAGDFARLATQPAVRDQLAMNAGTFTLNADGSYTPAIAAKGRLALDNVGAPALGTQRAGLTADFDANVSADFLTIAGTTAAEWKIGPRASAIKAFAKAAPKGQVSTFEATVTGSNVNVDDLLALVTPGGPDNATTATPTAAAATPAATTPDTAPFWSAYRGAVKADLQRVLYQGNELTDIGVELTVTADAVTAKRAGLKLAGSPLNAQGAMRFVAAQKERPYALDAAVTGKGIDTGALFKMLQPSEPPLVAMIADLDAKVTGAAANLDTLADGLNTNVHLVGTKGETRLFAAKSDLIAKLGNAGSGVGGLLTGLLGGSRREKEEPTPAPGTEGTEPKRKKLGTADYVRASLQLVQFFATTPFDHCEVEASSKGTSEFTVSKLTFNSPVIDIAAKGSAAVPPGGKWSSLVYQLELTRFGASGDIGYLLGELATVAPLKEGQTFTYLAKPVPLSGNLAQSNAVQLTATLLDKAAPFLQMMGLFR